MSTAIFFIPVAHAQQALMPPGACLSIFNDGGLGLPGQGWGCIPEYIAMITGMLIGFGAAIALIMIMINGIRYMVGPAFPGGSSDTAKKGITTALTGLAVALLTYLILSTFISYITQ